MKKKKKNILDTLSFITRAWKVARQEFKPFSPSLAEPPWAGNPVNLSLVFLLIKVEMCILLASLVAQTVKMLQAMQEMQVWSLGRGRPPGEGNGYPLQYSCLEKSMDKEPGGLQSMGSQRVVTYRFVGGVNGKPYR